jgi:hypothetical protein
MATASRRAKHTFESLQLAPQRAAPSLGADAKEPDMNASTTNLPKHQLRFRSLFDEGRGYAFPCDAEGHVDLDTLSERARTNYLYARVCIGRAYGWPTVETLQ